ncbi:MAG TPA: TadE/TadG family type IV pilus assembly protein [Acidimicrobiia bacterium]|nr:TadE/TadG family type IV pilus assembly protein [Acidimicrobiia bacterium]
MIRRFRAQKDRGANLVEFAFVMPFLLLLLLGIIEFAWVFATNLDVKHGAREGARVSAVSDPSGNNTVLGAEICARMDLAGGSPTSVTWQGVDLNGGGVGVGDGVVVTVETNTLSTLTGFLDWAFSSVNELTSTVETRIEQTPTWSDGTYNCT